MAETVQEIMEDEAIVLVEAIEDSAEIVQEIMAETVQEVTKEKAVQEVIIKEGQINQIGGFLILFM